MLLLGAPSAARPAPRRRRQPARCRVMTQAAATTSGDGAPPAKKPPTRKRMMDAMMREAEARRAAPPPPPPPPPRKESKKRAAAPRLPAADADDEVLDLSAFMAGGEAVADEEGTADSFGGVVEEEEGEDAGAFDDDFLTPAGEVDGFEAEAGQQVLNTWQYDSETGEVVFARVVKPAARPSAAASAAAVESMLARLEREGAAQGDGSDDESEEFDILERGLEDATLRVPTRLQKVDAGDVDEVIDALAGMDTGFLDKESLRLLEEELGRKKTEREKQQRRVADTSTAPPEGRRKTHRQLQIIAGTAQNYKLWSPQDMNTRPMMASVRGAVFSMLTSLSHGNGQTAGTFPPALRWLDLFAGTGAVGIEAVSRGVASAHFVELDPWIISNCLQRNLEHTRAGGAATVHNTTVESFIAAAAGGNLRLAGDAPFDFVSVCPPYEKVSYPELLASLEASPLVKPGTLLVVEYPKYERKCITDRIGRLEKIRDRAYGRTLVAVYECLAEDESSPRREALVIAEAEYDAEMAAGSEEEEEEDDDAEELEEDVTALGR